MHEGEWIWLVPVLAVLCMGVCMGVYGCVWVWVMGWVVWDGIRWVLGYERR